VRAKGGILAPGRCAYRQPRVDSSAKGIERGPIIRLGSWPRTDNPKFTLAELAAGFLDSALVACPVHISRCESGTRGGDALVVARAG
jgi:hypothetical protein